MKKNDRCRKAEQLAKVCAVKHLWRQDQEVGAASCCFHSKQLLAGTRGSRGKKMDGVFPLAYYFLVIITDCAVPSSSALGSGWWHFAVVGAMVSEMPFSEVKGISLLDLLLRHLSQTTVFVSQRTVSCFFSPFSYFYRSENPTISKWLKAFN